MATKRRSNKSNKATAAPARRGGRPRSQLPPELLERLGPPPTGQPLKLARWLTDAIALVTYEVLAGKPYAKLLETLRASAGAAGRVIPHDIVFEAQRRLAKDEQDMKSPHGGTKLVRREDDALAKPSEGPVRGNVRDPQKPN